MTAGIVILHILTIILTRLFKCEKYPKCKKLFEKILEYFQFGVYLRLILEAYVFMIMASFSEACRPSYFNSHPFSYVLAFFFNIVLFMFPVFIGVYYLLKRHKVSDNPFVHEIYKDMKNTHMCKLYHLVFTVRRIVIVVLVITLKDIETSYRLTTFTMFQLFAFGYCVLFKPFEGVKDNFIEIINDVTYFVLCVMIMILNQVDYTNLLLSIPMIYVVLANGAIVIITMYADNILTIVRRCRKSWAKKKKFANEKILPCFPENSKTIVINYEDDSRYCLQGRSVSNSLSNTYRKPSEGANVYLNSITRIKSNGLSINHLDSAKTMSNGLNIKDDLNNANRQDTLGLISPMQSLQSFRKSQLSLPVKPKYNESE